MVTHLFVYGTLLAEAEHPMGRLLEAHSQMVGKGRIRARLYIIEEEDEQGWNAYPGAVPSMFDDDIVHGVVYSLTEPDAVIPKFDNYEACAPGWPEPYEFLLRPVDVTMEDGQVLRAKSYLYTYDVTRAKHVPSGRYTSVSPDVR